MATPHVPDEILVELFSCLTCADLASVSLAARRFHCIAQPLLYKEPEIKDHANARTASLQAFVRTLLTTGCETLANHVRHLTISWGESEMPRSSPDYESFKITAARFGIDDSPLTGDIQVMLLMYLLQSLETLHLHPPGNTYWFHRVPDLHNPWQPQIPLPPGLHYLREFRSDLPVLVRPRALAFLLALPHLRSLTVPTCGDIELVMRGSSIPIRRSSCVTSLEFSYVRMPYEALKSVLEIPHALTHFYFRAMRSANPIRFDLALAPLRGSLQTLVLEFAVRATPLPRPDPAIGLSLRDWPALRNVAVPLVVLLGLRRDQVETPELADVLPPGIATLRLVEDDFWTGAEAATALVRLVGRKEEVVPRLESVGLWEAVDGQVGDRLSGVCATAGVRILGAGADLGAVFAPAGGHGVSRSVRS